MAKSAGQWIGTAVGAVIGAFIPGGYIMLGASIGGAIGGLIDPPKGPKIEGPRINDLNVQTATYGAQIPVIKGTVATFGNIFWVENNRIKETKKTESQGGKGGGGQETTTYTYSATFALGICLGPVDGIRRIWCSGKLIFDAGSNDISAVMASALTGGVLNRASFAKRAMPEAAGGGGITFYNGGPDQQPDPRMQAALGVANTPAYRGLAYLLFQDFQLADFGNTLMGAQFKIEVVDTASVDQYAIRTRVPSGLFPQFSDEYADYSLSTSGPYNPVIENAVFRFDKERTRYNVTMDGALISRGTAPGIAPGSTGDPGERFYVGTTSGGHAVYYNATGPGTSGWLVVGGNTQFSGRFSPGYVLQGACVGTDGNLYLITYDGSGTKFEKYDGIDLFQEWSQDASLPWNVTTIAYPYLPGTPAAIVVNEGNLLWFLTIAGQEVNFTVHDIAEDGVLTEKHTFTSEGGTGWDGHTVTAAATGMLCAITHDHGGFYVFDATPIVVEELVPLSEIVESLCLQSNLLTSSDLNVTALTQDVRGYRISATAAIRAALEPLQACWPFDAIQDGYKIKFIPRGGSSVATVSSDDLGATAPGDKEMIRLSVAREMDTQLPRRVESTFIDYNREYDTGAGPGAERLNTDAVNIRQIELPVVLTVDEAAGIEQTLLYLAWTERQDISFTLPPTYCALQPSDVITVNSTDSSYMVRLTRIQYLPDGRLECAAKYNHAPIYTPAAVGQEGAVTGKTLEFGGPTTLALLDVPCMDSTIMDKPGILSAATGVYSGWPGATLMRSNDSGQSYQAVDGYAAGGAVISYATVTIGSGVTHLVDTASLLTVRPLRGTLASVTELQMLNGANHFAYGAHGRWEIIAAKTVTDNSDGTFTLQNLMRGRFGTEQYVGTHAANDAVILLDQSVLRFTAMDVASINLTRLWRAVTRGAILDSAQDVPFSYSGVNLTPLSPVKLAGYRSAATFDWHITWTRRTRLVVEPFSGIDQPIGETSESYDFEIWDSGYTTLKRVFSGLTSAAAQYTSAQQIVDFNANQETLYCKVFQNSSVIGRGAPLQGSIQSNLAADPYFPFVVFGLHMNGTNGSTTFSEITGKTVTANGNAQISTAQYANLTGNSSSGYFDGTGDFLNATLTGGIGAGDMTIDLWVRESTFSGDRNYIAINNGAVVNVLIGNTNTGSGDMRFLVRNDSGTTNIDLSSAGATISLNTWAYIRAVVSGSKAYLFINGTLVNSGSLGGSRSGSGTDLQVARLSSGTPRYFTGYLDDLRITKGIARSTSSFTVPSIQFPDS